MVAINAFHTDTKAEIDLVRKMAEQAGARVAVSKHWQYGGEGALELADAVIDACNEKVRLQVPLRPGHCRCGSGWSGSPRRSTAPTA